MPSSPSRFGQKNSGTSAKRAKLDGTVYRGFHLAQGETDKAKCTGWIEWSNSLKKYVFASSAKGENASAGPAGSTSSTTVEASTTATATSSSVATNQADVKSTTTIEASSTSAAAVSSTTEAKTTSGFEFTGCDAGYCPSDEFTDEDCVSSEDEDEN
ncbi:unnamed protein product [Amoebophrya sp. A25]|nr:unnamed protein product [Amoebophrya sp. A25]|eukprot:GSA25T00015030001.1